MFSPRQSRNENELLQTRQQTAPKAGPIQKKQNTSHLSICLLLGNSIYRLAYKSSSNFFSSAKRKLQIFYVFCSKSEPKSETSSFALRPTTGTGNEKRRTLRKSILYIGLFQYIICPVSDPSISGRWHAKWPLLTKPNFYL